MTFDDAIEQTLRELGYSDFAIQSAKRAADIESANTIAWGHQRIPEGMEQEFLNALKNLYTLPRDQLAEVQRNMNKLVQEHDAKN